MEFVCRDWEEEPKHNSDVCSCLRYWNPFRREEITSNPKQNRREEEKVGEKAGRVRELKARGSQTVNKSSKKIKIRMKIIVKLTRFIPTRHSPVARECLENFEKVRF